MTRTLLDGPLFLVLISPLLLRTVTADIHCVKDAYPPAANSTVPKLIINLDLPPAERWKEVVHLKRNEMTELRDALVNLAGKLMNGIILKLLNKFGHSIHATLPSPYKEELQGLSDLTGMNIGEVVLYNIFYEFFTVCTSIVAQNEQDTIHARNLDFGLFLGWNASTHMWSMTEVLRKNVLELEWQRRGLTVFRSVNFAGYVGLLTAVSKGKLSFSLNDRFNRNGGFIGLIQWLVMRQRDLKWVGFLSREIFEQELTFDEAKDALIQARLIAPVYFIIGGTKRGEGVILTKDRNKATADIYSMDSNGANFGDWYVLETNYDHWEQTPFFDDRRSSGHHCMHNLTSQGVSFSGLFNVLSTQPNLNKLTAYTALMNVKTGEMETYIRRCAGSCSPW